MNAKPNTALAERMSLSPRQIQRYIAELESGGFIKRGGLAVNLKKKASEGKDE